MSGPRVCSVEGCGRPCHGRGLCSAHLARQRRGRPLDLPIAGGPVVVGDDLYMPCPPGALLLVDAVSEIDARAILRTIWPHLLEARLAGVQPFTLEVAS